MQLFRKFQIEQICTHTTYKHVAHIQKIEIKYSIDHS